MQQIVSQLLFAGAENLEVASMSPCLEHRIPDKVIKLPQVDWSKMSCIMLGVSSHLSHD